MKFVSTSIRVEFSKIINLAKKSTCVKLVRNIRLQWSVFAFFMAVFMAVFMSVSVLSAKANAQAVQSSNNFQQVGVSANKSVQNGKGNTFGQALSKVSVLPFVGVGFTSTTDEYTNSDLEVSSWSPSLSRYFGYGLGVGYKVTNEIEVQGTYSVLPGAVVIYDNYIVLDGCKNQNSSFGLSCEVDLAYSGFGLEVWYKRLGLGVLSWERELQENGLDDDLTATLFPDEANSGLALTISGRFGALDEGVSVILKYIALKDELVNSSGTQLGSVDGMFLATVGYRFVL